MDIRIHFITQEVTTPYLTRLLTKAYFLITQEQSAGQNVSRAVYDRHFNGVTPYGSFDDKGATYVE